MLTTIKPTGAKDEFKDLLVTGNNAENSVLAACYDWLPNRKEVVKRLNSLADQLDESHKTANKRTMAGSGVSVLGGGAVIAGLALAPFTGGISALLTTYGGAASFLGGVTVVGSSLNEKRKKKSACKDVQSLIDRDKIYTKNLLALLERVKTTQKNIFALLQNTPFTDEELVEMAKQTSNLCKETAIGKIVLVAICSLISSISLVAPQLLQCLEKVGIQTKKFKDFTTPFWNSIRDTGKNLFSAPAQLSRFARIGLILSAGGFLAVDIWTMVSVYKDMKKGSKSDDETKFRELAQSLETEMDDIKKIIEHWCEDDPDLYPC